MCALIFSLGGCSLLVNKALEDVEIIESSGHEVMIFAELDKSVYRPGEAMILTVTATNTTDETLPIRKLIAAPGPPASVRGPLTFWFGPANGQRRMQRYPVISDLEIEQMKDPSGDFTVALAPGETISRRFLLTEFTAKPGGFIAQAHFDAFGPGDSSRIGKVFTNSIQFEVYGDRLYERDNKGLILYEEAINLAAARAPGDITLADAILIKDPAGFLKWWVNIDIREPQGKPRKIGYLVDPYRGRVLEKRGQYAPKMNPRLDRTPPDGRQVRRQQLGVLPRPN